MMTFMQSAVTTILIMITAQVEVTMRRALRLFVTPSWADASWGTSFRRGHPVFAHRRTATSQVSLSENSRMLVRLNDLMRRGLHAGEIGDERARACPS